MAKILLVGLESGSAQQLCDTLIQSRHVVETRPAPVPAAEILGADLIFAGDATDQYLPLLRRARELAPGLPVVVVTRMPDTNRWIDALEAGAADYCAAPLSRNQLDWLLESLLPKHAAAAV